MSPESTVQGDVSDCVIFPTFGAASMYLKMFTNMW